MILATPWAFLALIILPIIFYREYTRRGTARLRFSSVQLFSARVSFRQRLIYLPLALRLAAIALIIFGMARPQTGLEKIQDVSKGVAIEMVIDRSGSMGAEMEFDGKAMTRLEAVKRVFAEFVQGNDQELAGRSNDLIGMVSFAKFADTICPLTLGHGALAGFLETFTLVPRDSQENRTAIGDAIALAAARLKTAEEVLARQTGADADKYEIKSKIMILLTDGENNAGQYAPLEAAELAKKWGIKIYAIGVGGDEMVKVQTLLGTRMMRTGGGVDRKTLSELADVTGGKFWMAEDAKGLREVYEEVDRLEKSEVESIRFVDYKEYYMPMVMAALILLVVETILRCTVLRKIP